MCGILGIAGLKEALRGPVLRDAINTFAYRGPDDEGYYLNRAGTVGLAHKRLSILDLSGAGRQPMSDDEGSLHIVFNGEIYNFPWIKDELTAAGYRFASTSDTEVLLYAYKHWGAGCLDRINGMFAFAVYDEKAGKLFLARDRLGKKPLFYADTGNGLVFASELKAILATGLLAAEVDPEAVDYYFSLGYVPGEMCIVRGARKLPAGHLLEYQVDTGRSVLRRYWDLPRYEGGINEAEATEEVERLLADAVSARLLSDVPLGAFLSGGVDSSLVVAFMRKVHNGEIKTFSVGFEGSARSELKYARMVAEHLGTRHSEIVIRPDFEAGLELVSGLLDEPIFDNSVLPTYYLSKYTREHVTVAISGDGGDELFGGYIHYSSALAARRISAILPGFLRGSAEKLSRLLPDGAFGKNTLYGIGKTGRSCFVHPLLIFKPEEKELLFKPGFFSGSVPDAPARYREALMDNRYDFVGQMLYADIKTALPDDILVKVDRASMFNSLEVRCPLLDYRLAEFSLGRVPGRLKIKNGVKKYLLKRLAGKYLPEDLDIERKQGFDMPGDLLVRTFLLDRVLEFPGNEFISRPFVEKLVNEQRGGRGNMWNKLFALYFFMRWLESWRR